MDNKNFKVMHVFDDEALISGDHPPQANDNNQIDEREHWTGRADFVLSCAGYCIGIGNIWRFPYLCYKNGGGAFLIPYLLFTFIGAFPMFLLEYSMAQYSGRGPFNIWIMLCPLMKGAGYGIIIVNLYIIYYYNAMLGWVLYYLYHSFTPILPWSTCDNHWNTQACYDNKDKYNQSHLPSDVNISFLNRSLIRRLTPSEEFWRFNVLQLTDGIDDMGAIRFPLLICFMIAWFITFISVCWGIKVTGKIVYVTVILPYIVLIMFLIKGAMLPGSINGLKFYLIPKWDTLLTPKIWGEAAIQIFFSSGMGYGGLLAYASYNKFDNNVIRDAMIGPIMNSGTSIFAGFVTFCILGYMAEEKGVTVDDVVTQGPGLIFEAYPAALAKFELSSIWSVLFFLLMLCIGVDSLFGMVETVICCIRDMFPCIRHRKIWISAILSVVFFILGIPLVMQGGIYVIQIIDWYFMMFTFIVVCILECIIVGWIYGVPQFNRDIQQMVGHQPGYLWGVCWKYVTPLSSILVLIFNMTQLQPVSYGDYQYPSWAIVVGWLIGLSSLLPIFVFFITTMLKQDGKFLERIREASKPTDEWGPQLHCIESQQVDAENIKTDDSNL